MDIAATRTYLETQLPDGLEWLRRMVELNSFTGNKEGVDQVGRLTAEAFLPLGFSSEFVPSTNPAWGEHLVLTRAGHSANVIATVAHLDTVFPPEEEIANDFHWKIEGDRIFGPGTLDIKGGSVMIWLVLNALREIAPEEFNSVSWKLFWNSSEECLSPDFESVCRSRLGPNPGAILVFEGENRAGENHLLVASRKARFTWRISVHGRSAHAGGELAHGANAIVQLARVLQEVDAMTDFSRDLTFNVGQVDGGTVLNRVPHFAIAEGEFRAFKNEVCEQAKARLLGLAGTGNVRSRVDGYPCDVQVEITSASRAWPQNAGTESLIALWTRTGAELGMKMAPENRGGLSDGNTLWDLGPTIDGLGPYGANDHCSERSSDGLKLPEYVLMSSFVPKALLNAMAIKRLIMSLINKGKG